MIILVSLSFAICTLKANSFFYLSWAYTKTITEKWQFHLLNYISGVFILVKLKLSTESFHFCFQKFFRKFCRQRTHGSTLCEARLSTRMQIRKWQTIYRLLFVSQDTILHSSGLGPPELHWIAQHPRNNHHFRKFSLQHNILRALRSTHHQSCLW